MSWDAASFEMGAQWHLVESKSPVRWPGAPTEARVALCDLLRTYTPRWLRSRWAVVA